MLQRFRRHSRSLTRQLLALASLLWITAAVAPCLMDASCPPRCAEMDTGMPCSHAAPLTHDAPCAAALDCAQSDSHAPAPAAFSFAAPLLVLLALVALPLARMLPDAHRWAVPDRQRAPDPPLHLQLARLLT